jgi:hypothetical protein
MATHGSYETARKHLETRNFSDALRFAHLAQKQGHDRVQILQLVAIIKLEMNLPGDVLDFES